MLILTRKQGEAIFIGDNIKVYVLGIEKGQVKIGVDAPRNVQVVRDNAILKTPKDRSQEEV